MSNNLYNSGITHPEYTKGFVSAFVTVTAEEMEEDPYIGVYIPKIMGYEIDPTESKAEETIDINKDIFLNSDDDKLELESSVISTNYIKVKPMGQSNIKPPIVGKGETLYVVFIEEDIKQPRYLYYNPNEVKRAVDEYTIFVGGKEDGDCEIEDSYMIKISTKEKFIQIHTSKENEEDFAYDLTINTKDSQIILTDNDDNTAMLDSNEKQWKFVNKDESVFDIHGEDISAECKGKYTVKCKEYKVEASSKIEMKSDDAFEVSSKKYKNEATISYEAKSVTRKEDVSAKYNATAPMNMLGGMVCVGSVKIGKGSGADIQPAVAGWDDGGIMVGDAPMNMVTSVTPLLISLNAMNGALKVPPVGIAAVSGSTSMMIGNKIKF